MEPVRTVPAWLSHTRILIVAGKGGVGSSTVAAASALLAADAGTDVLLLAVDGKPGLGPLLGGRPLDSKEQVLRTVKSAGGRVRGRTITAEESFGDYLALKGVGGLVRRAAAAASLDLIAASTPGLEHLLVLGKIKELDRERVADLIIVDVPPAGHAASFLRSASALQRVVATGPLREQADEVAAMLADHTRCQCVLVTLAEETPVNEVVELAFDLEEDLGLALGPLVVNACWADRAGFSMKAADAAKRQGITVPAAARRALDDVARSRRASVERQQRQLVRLDERLPLPQIHLPRLPTARFAAGGPRCPRRGTRDRADGCRNALVTIDGSVAAPDIGRVLLEARLVVTCGPGGVGKTSTAAALALAAANSGRKVIVVTVDPARRLADALGIGEAMESHEPHEVAGATTDSAGSLWALMLDAESTFDRLIIDRVDDEQRAQSILANPVYRGIAGSLAGAQEYMAIERLHQLWTSAEFDLIVVDTPPSRHAVDLLEAPDRLVSFFGHPVYRAVTLPSRSFATCHERGDLRVPVGGSPTRRTTGGRRHDRAVPFAGGRGAGFARPSRRGESNPPQ